MACIRSLAATIDALKTQPRLENRGFLRPQIMHQTLKSSNKHSEKRELFKGYLTVQALNQLMSPTRLPWPVSPTVAVVTFEYMLLMVKSLRSFLKGADPSIKKQQHSMSQDKLNSMCSPQHRFETAIPGFCLLNMSDLASG